VDPSFDSSHIFDHEIFFLKEGNPQCWCEEKGDTIEM
jgi:hypothetical protein